VRTRKETPMCRACHSVAISEPLPLRAGRAAGSNASKFMFREPVHSENTLNAFQTLKP